MQFVSNGPDIPDALLQAHEEDRVVFFCGAGISYLAGLPGFKGLVDKIYQCLGTTRKKLEDEAYNKEQFDITLNLLERRLPGQRIAVRKALAGILQPDLQCDGATDTHAALLRLARGRDDNLRLVTTNFDRIFEHIGEQSKRAHHVFAAPTLPIPKTSRWDGLVYLHGLLPQKPNEDESALHRLVVTSGDFGLAYLTEQWASRFVSELFRNYVVCFVGYSINDPVLRYMMDALAADRMLGEATPRAYALGDCKPDQEEVQSIEWQTKGVSPILYEIYPGKNPHLALHETLKAWAEIHRDGIFGKEQIVARHALPRPSESTQQDDFVGRVLWALSDKSGRPAKRFAELNPAPPIEWLAAFSENRLRYGELSRFGISPQPHIDPDLQFSLINRPAPHDCAPRMTLVGSNHDTGWDIVMEHIAHWLTRHLNNPQLIYWLVENGSRLHDRLAWLIESRLDDLDKLNREGRSGDPDTIPDQRMRLLWHLLLRGRVKSFQNFQVDAGLSRWVDHLKRDGLTVSLRMQFRKFLSPMIELKKPFPWHDGLVPWYPPEHLRSIVDWDLVLATDHVQSIIGDRADEHWRAAFPVLLDDLHQLLRDALDLLRELGGAVDRSDGSFVVLPSIEPHWQNRRSRDWVTLIELLRDAWQVVQENDPARAIRIAEGWFDLPYPTFKRLALFAASQDGCIDLSRWVDWLLAEKAWWLWSEETQREVMRLLVLQGHRLSSSQGMLEAAILDGPPRRMYPEGLEPERWEEIVKRSVWLRLAKLDASGLQLGNAAQSRFVTLSSANPSWELLPHEQEEFPHWMSGTGDPDYADNREIDIAPRERRELVRWLKDAPSKGHWSEDTWRDMCRTRFFHCLFALCDLSEEGIWPADRWREALQVWSEEGLVQRSWRYAAPLVSTMPDDILEKVAHGVAWWLYATSKSGERHDEILLDLSQRILNLPLEPGSALIMTQGGEPIRRPVTEAINHPIGLVTQALVSLWFRREPNDNDRLPVDIEPLFTQMCDTQVERFRHGRAVLASRLIALFRVDRSWTEQHLLPLFRWKENSMDAQIAWEGFLWSARPYRPLINAFRPQFIETASHYDDLGEFSRQYAVVLTYAALEFTDADEATEFQTAFNALPKEGLQEVARTLSQALESAGEQRKDYWTNRIQPFWQKMWPKSLDRVSGDIAEPLAFMIIAAGDQFSDAVDLVHGWLRPIKYPGHFLRRLQKSSLCAKFPIAALRLLNAVISNPQWPLPELGKCLTDISTARQDMQTDRRYQKLQEYVG